MVNSLYDIDPQKLKKRGIRGIVFDLDNTIIPWDQPTMSPEIIQWLQELLAQDFKLCLVSNNMGKRVKKIAEIINIPFVARAYKPAKSGFRQAGITMKLPAHQIAVVGDQLFTDVLGGNRVGFHTIWVTPLTTTEFIGTKITRRLEKIAVYILRNKGFIK